MYIYIYIFIYSDVDDKGSVDFDGLRRGLTKLGHHPDQLSEEDRDNLTHSGALCDEDNALVEASFAAVMRAHLSIYAQRLLAIKTEQNICSCVSVVI